MPVIRRHKISLGAVIAYALVVIYAAYFVALTVRTQRSMGTSAFDFGLYDQGIWLMSRGKAPFVTLMGRNLLGDHSSFVLLPLVPLYWVFSSTATLFVVQSIAIAAGALPVFWYSRKALQSEILGAAMVAVYLLHPAVSFTALENFHPDAFLGLFVGMVLYGAIEKKWRIYFVAVALAMLVKEDVALVIVPLGIWVALRRDAKRGVGTVVGALAAMAFLFMVWMKHFTGVAFRNSWRIPFGGPSGLLKTALRRPWKLVAYLASDGRPTYLFQMLAPVGFVFVTAPDVVAIGAVVLFTNILSTFWYQYNIEYHYSLVVVPTIVIGTAYALSRARQQSRRLLVALVLGASLVAAFVWSPLPGARTEVQVWRPDHPAVPAAHELFSLIPADSRISVYHQLAGQLARRQYIYSFPNPFVRSLYGPDVFAMGDRLPQADTIDYVMLPRELLGEPGKIWEAERDDFVVVAENDFWVLYQRSSLGATVTG